MSGAHEMVPGGFGHGTSHCKHCFATEREIAFALGPVCSAAPTPPATPSQGLDAATVERCAQVAETEAAAREALRDRSRPGTMLDEMLFEQVYMLKKTAARIRALATDPHQHGGKGA